MTRLGREGPGAHLDRCFQKAFQDYFSKETSKKLTFGAGSDAHISWGEQASRPHPTRGAPNSDECQLLISVNF